MSKLELDVCGMRHLEVTTHSPHPRLARVYLLRHTRTYVPAFTCNYCKVWGDLFGVHEQVFDKTMPSPVLPPTPESAIGSINVCVMRVAHTLENSSW